MKKTILLLVFVSSLITNLYSQDEDCSCKTDLTFLDSSTSITSINGRSKLRYVASYF